MSERLAGKVAIVTGGAGTIGSAVCSLLAQQGAAVLVNDIGLRTGSDASAVAERIRIDGGRAQASTTSATWDGAHEIVAQALDAFGRVDILINNATAGGAPSDLWDVSEDDFDLAMDVNVKGYFAMIRAVSRHFARQRDGVVLNMSSGAGFGHAAMVPYGAAKEAVIGMTRSVARDLGRFGVRCNAVRPLALGISSGEYLERTARWIKLIWLTSAAPGAQPMAKAATAETHPPAKVAPMIAWLCTDAARAVNGRTFHVRGDSIALLTEIGPEQVVERAGGWDLDALDALAPTELIAGLANDFLLEGHPDLQTYPGD